MFDQPPPWFSLIAFLLILPLNRLTLELSVLALFLAASYPFTKRFFAMPQAYLGIAFSFGIPMAFAAQTGGVPFIAWVLMAANLFWVIAYDTEYAMVDKVDDLMIAQMTSFQSRILTSSSVTMMNLVYMN